VHCMSGCISNCCIKQTLALSSSVFICIAALRRLCIQRVEALVTSITEIATGPPPADSTPPPPQLGPRIVHHLQEGLPLQQQCAACCCGAYMPGASSFHSLLACLHNTDAVWTVSVCVDIALTYLLFCTPYTMLRRDSIYVHPSCTRYCGYMVSTRSYISAAPAPQTINITARHCPATAGYTSTQLFAAYPMSNLSRCTITMTTASRQIQTTTCTSHQ
jgi:hypothetical protein